MRPVWTGAAILGITLLNFFQFPGHTWLQSDTQIYAPILEHFWNPAVLQKDLIAQHPHVAFTLYDETALALRWATGLDFHYVLEAEQFVVRALGIWGVYLVATALGLSDLLALMVAAVFSLGATILGPSVLVFEYEPVPRGLAVPLMFLATGLIAHERFLGGGVAASVAFLMHAPTVFPFWVVYLAWAVWPSRAHTMRRKLIPLWVLAAAGLVLLAASLHETSSAETRPFFTRLDPHQEELQRMRAAYNYISLWWRQRIVHYMILYAATIVAVWRLRRDMPQALRFFCLGLPLMGLASIPVSVRAAREVALGADPGSATAPCAAVRDGIRRASWRCGRSPGRGEQALRGGARVAGAGVPSSGEPRGRVALLEPRRRSNCSCALDARGDVGYPIRRALVETRDCCRDRRAVLRDPHMGPGAKTTRACTLPN